jgi:hypothetical protein
MFDRMNKEYVDNIRYLLKYGGAKIIDGHTHVPSMSYTART